MRVPVGWLRDLLGDLPEDGALADLLAGLGLGVERVEPAPAAPAGVVVARVDTIEPVAGHEHLRRVRIFEGARERWVVCGAPNVRIGMLSAYAPPGVTLPGTDGPLTEREVAGVRSEGMLCSPRELGLYDHAAGLIEFGIDTSPGDALVTLWPAETVIELELTPNRADAFSLLGVARDLAAKLHLPWRHPAAGLEGAFGDPDLDDGLRVHIADRERCPRVVLRRVDGLRVGPSPVWLQRRLAHLGLRPRNVVVDVTNFVTFELGQPSHAYDLRALATGTLEVRRARLAERLTTLTDEVLVLEPDDLRSALRRALERVAAAHAGAVPEGAA
jgi:phenylalanyl-tRNA synthetase beta chain